MTKYKKDLGKKAMLKGIFILLSMIFAISPIIADSVEKVINTECDETSPVISPDGNTLYYCKIFCNDSNKSDEIYYVVKNKKGEWSQPKNIGRPLNNSMNNFVSSVSPDGNTLLLGTVYPTKNDRKIREGVAISHKTDNGWSYPENQIIKNYYNKKGYAGFYLSNNGKYLLMTIEREDTKGKKDLYVSFLEESGIWSEPLNLGSDVNTAEDEISPFLASDGETIYFSSEGHNGYGSADIYMARRLDDSWQNWSKPHNLGKEINTKDWDAFFKIDASGKSAFLTRRNSIRGDMDIVKIFLPKNARPKPVLLVKGQITSYKSGAPLNAEITFQEYHNETVIGKSISNKTDGNYAQTLPAGLTYSFVARSDGYLKNNKKVDLVDLEEYEEFDVPIQLVPKSDSLICLRNIFFQTAKSKITDDGMKEINYLTKFLLETKDVVVEISGFTDNIGSESSNLELSKQRAEEAKEILVKAGIEEHRITHQGYGSARPVVSNSSQWGRALNRRIEFKVFRKIN